MPTDVSPLPHLSSFQRLPRCIAVPWDRIALELEVPPVLTLSAASLWNYRALIHSVNGYVIAPENLEALQTFTGSFSESWFYVISVAIEARSTAILPLLLSSLQAVRRRDISQLIMILDALAAEIAEMERLLCMMHSKCDPSIFYNAIRPYLTGWKNQSAAGLPNGVIYEGTFSMKNDHHVNWENGYRTYAGGSNAQSPLIQALDIVMGINHRGSREEGFQSKTHSFLHEMRRYMPGPHRRFLEDLSKVSDLRDFIIEYPEGDVGADLRLAYDKCVVGLVRFRDIHMQIACRYILLPSRKATSMNPSMETGTGGTQLVPFLKHVRRETMEGIADEGTRSLIAKRQASIHS